MFYVQRRREAALHAPCQLLQAWLSAQKETSVLWMKTETDGTQWDVLKLHIQRGWQRYSVRSVSCLRHLIDMKGETAFWKWSWITLCGEPALLLRPPLKHTVVTSASERQRLLAACVLVCDYVCVCVERGVLSVMSHTEKIKVLMAWAS